MSFQTALWGDKKVDVLKDMLMYREDKRQCIFTNDELESIIRYVCTE